VIIGLNRIYPHGGHEYHIQAEDLGVEQAAFEVRVYEQGTVLWRKRVTYTDVLEQRLAKPEQEEALRSLMEKTVHTVEAAISKGKLGAAPSA
jgi:hypothetical protein